MRLRAWVSVVIGVGACVLLWGHWWLFGITAFLTVGAFWSLGIISNYGLRAEVHWRDNLRRNMLNEGYSEEEIAGRLRNVPAKTNSDHVPEWPVMLNMLFALACLGLLITGLMLKLRG